MPGLHFTQLLGHTVCSDMGKRVVFGVVVSCLEIVLVPQSNLGDRWVESDLVHPSIFAAKVWLAGIPQTLMENEHGAG